MGIEYELKFQATEDILRSVRLAFADEHQEYAMQTTYYDTPSGALSARHYTLRQRMENETAVCTLKTPAGKNRRQELETECADIREAVLRFSAMGAPEDLPNLVREGLEPICGAKFHRTAIRVALPDCVLELALDQGVLTGGRRSMSFCELEVELKEGPQLAAQVFAAELVQQYGLVPEPLSKFRRALDLYKGDRL